MQQKSSLTLLDSIGNLVFLESVATVGQHTYRLRFFPGTPKEEIWFLGICADLAKEKFRTLSSFGAQCRIGEKK
jgi:hypothetical protein